MSLTFALLFVPGLLIGITVHEFAHAWSASLLGDRFARRLGRVSLNPLQHLTPLGTLAMFFLPFGWGRPVPVNLYNFARPRRDYLLTSLAGPAANLVTLCLCLALMQFTRHTYTFGTGAALFMIYAHSLLLVTAIANAILAVFNLIPLPPLDGSKIWPYLFRSVKPSFNPSMRWVYWGILIVLMTTNALNPAFGAVVETVQRLTPPQDAQVVHDFVQAAEEAHRDGRDAQAEKLLDQALAIHPRSERCRALRDQVRAARTQPADQPDRP